MGKINKIGQIYSHTKFQDNDKIGAIKELSAQLCCGIFEVEAYLSTEPVQNS
jgi:hypothetical protein